MSLSLTIAFINKGYRIHRKVYGRELLKRSHPSKKYFQSLIYLSWWPESRNWSPDGLVGKFSCTFEDFLVCTFFLHISAHFCSFALVVSGEILLRMVVTRRSILAQRPLFAQAGIPISQSVYRGQPGKNKMGRFQILHRNMFYCL